MIIEVYGDPEEHPQKETYWGHVNPIGPRACYDEGKRIAETLTYAYMRQNDVDVRVARIFKQVSCFCFLIYISFYMFSLFCLTQ